MDDVEDFNNDECFPWNGSYFDSLGWFHFCISFFVFFFANHIYQKGHGIVISALWRKLMRRDQENGIH